AQPLGFLDAEGIEAKGAEPSKEVWPVAEKDADLVLPLKPERGEELADDRSRSIALPRLLGVQDLDDVLLPRPGAREAIGRHRSRVAREKGRAQLEEAPLGTDAGA